MIYWVVPCCLQATIILDYLVSGLTYYTVYCTLGLFMLGVCFQHLCALLIVPALGYVLRGFTNGLIALVFRGEGDEEESSLSHVIRHGNTSGTKLEGIYCVCVCVCLYLLNCT